MAKNKKNILNNKNVVIFSVLAAVIIFAGLFMYSRDKHNVVKENEVINTPEDTVEITEGNNDVETVLEGDTFISPIMTDIQTGEKFTFSLEIPEDWTVSKYEKDKLFYKLSLEKNAYYLDIISSETSPSICLYEDASAESSELGVMYGDFKQLETSFGQIRVAKYPYETSGLVLFDGCQRYNLNPDPIWDTGTKIGMLRYRLPSEYDEEMLSEMNYLLMQIQVHPSEK